MNNISRLPKRHGPVNSDIAQHLALPQEIVDFINQYLCFGDILSLRLACKTFDVGLFSTFVNKINRSSFLFYLGDEGIDDVVRLLASRLAPFVKHVRLADRVPATNLLVFREVDGARRDANLEMLARHKMSTASLQRDLLSITRTLKSQKRDRVLVNPGDTYISTHENDKRCRSHRQRAAFEAQFSGWDVDFEQADCNTTRSQKLQPSKTSIDRLVSALARFTNLEEITTDKEYEVLGQAKDIEGRTVSKTVFHGDFDWFDATDGVVMCKCGKRKKKGYPGYGCGLQTENIVWPAVIELGTLCSLLPTTLPLFDTLKCLELNFYRDIALDHAADLIKQNADTIARFISKCQSLQKLSLVAKQRWMNEAEKVVSVIQAIIKYLVSNNVVFTSLSELWLDHIDPNHHLVGPWLISHARGLRALDLPSCLSGATNVDLWIGLLDALGKSAHLAHAEIDQLKGAPPTTNRAKIMWRALWYVHSTNVDEGTDVRHFFLHLVGLLRKWDGNSSMLAIQAGQGF